MATSFKKKSSRGRSVFIPGTRPSLHNNQLLVSTGIPSMDAVIGGGVAVGTVVMIEEDNYGSYARQILKYFLAEGVVSGHGLFLASADIDPQTILKDLPHPLDHGDDNTDSTNQEDTMKIAWRYQQKSKVQSNPSHNRFGHYYDLSRVMDEKKLDTIPVRMFNAAEECTSDSPKNRSNSLYEKLLSEVNSTITDGGYSTTAAKQQQERSILRIAIHSLGSQLWGEECGATCVDFSPALPWFLYSLRATLRSSLVVCMVTIPTHVFQDSGFTHRIERLCDTVLALESFAGSDKETNPLYRDYHGLFNIVRLPRLNTLTTHMPDSLDLAFKLKRKKFSIETLHLPPDLSESVSRNQEEAIRPKPGALACQTGSGNSKLDF
ncbi:elongator complex protein 4-like isoform X1 [Actinia tenebrosa]|uniref:Elongator complex protein 4 n=1 Tax=Actinia tenebrosa TaxID=6105 RepID=A0A6P8HTE1_ACTTE|nr:elongator complex protein 4-like isoform X1 [Actinia tenebrosa]